MESTNWIHNVPVPIFGMDLGGNINAWNSSIQSVLGYSAADVLDQPISTIIQQSPGLLFPSSTSSCKKSLLSAKQQQQQHHAPEVVAIDDTDDDDSNSMTDDSGPDNNAGHNNDSNLAIALSWITSPTHQLQFRTKSSNEERRNLTIYASARVDSNGNIVGVFGVTLDATESLKMLTNQVDDLRQLEILLLHFF